MDDPKTVPLGVPPGAPVQIAPETARLMRRGTYAAVTVAGVLIAVKLAALVVTGSVSILASLADSAIDALASLVNLFAVRHALKPADRQHRFGHGKAEAIAGLGQAAFVAGSAVFLLFQATERLIHPKPLANTEAGIGVMVFSILATLALILYQRHVVRRTGSLAIGADSLHYKGDLLVNASVIAALVLSAALGWTGIDALFGVGIALYILYTAWTIANASLGPLMDRELPEAARERIRVVAEAHPEVVAIHDLRTRSAGLTTFIQFHMEVDGKLDLHTVHGIADDVEVKVRAAFPDSEVIIHMDPEGLDEAHATFA
ncbi:MAG: cation diffusion facilitator family transporter [Alphaproteobacteria bacterium]